MRPLIREIDYRSPVELFTPWRDAPCAALLDGAGGDRGTDDYAYVAVEPFSVVAAQGDAVYIDGRRVETDPFTTLAGALAPHRIETVPGLPPFQGGAVGLLGYELGRHLERLPDPWPDDLGAPDLWIGLYDVVVAFDKRARRAFIVSTGLPEHDPARRRQRAATRAEAVAERIAGHGCAPRPAPGPHADWTAEVDGPTYEARVQAALALIRAGDIYQANLSQRFHAPLPDGLQPLDLFRRLQVRLAAPFGAYLALGGEAWLASASPERFLRLSADGAVETRPIKGTRPRAADPAEDAALAAELMASAKDRAENLMIVDLLRNDLSRICVPGSVTVPRLCTHERFAAVHHLVSEVRGRLAPGRGPIDLLRAAFPGGSVTGAPKIRAMEVIHALEVARRGPYCGAVAWIGFDGAMDSSIVIRSLTVARGRVWAQAGGGIVADSDPLAEYHESLVKVRPLLEVLGGIPVSAPVPAEARP